MSVVNPVKRRIPKRSAVIGQSLLETAIAFPLFAVLFCGILDFGRLFYTQMTLQHALREAARFAVTGRHLANSANPAVTYNRTNSIFQVARNAASGASLDGFGISSVQGGTNSAGGPSDTVTISISQDLRLVTPLVPMLAGYFKLPHFMNDGVYRITAKSTFRNESFAPSQTN